ncbi:MAG: hypothetical protein IKU40_01300, partial [Clostridia bacterium]|nr:hypothetical protein [Clostridia bacterium]
MKNAVQFQIEPRFFEHLDAPSLFRCEEREVSRREFRAGGGGDAHRSRFDLSRQPAGKEGFQTGGIKSRGMASQKDKVIFWRKDRRKGR